MDFTYEIGRQDQPKGHALVYCRNVHDPSEIFATYVVVPPIHIDLTKYLPPMITSQISLENMGSGTSSVPLPPMLERVEGYEWLRQLAELRGDDLIAAGVVDPGALPTVLALVQEAAQIYHAHYTTYGSRPTAQTPSLDVSDVLYSVMGEPELVRELAKLTGQLRYAVGGRDERLTRETVAEMERLAKHMPPKYRVDELITVGKVEGEKGDKLVALYVERCYKLAAEKYREVQSIDQQIDGLQST